jgi:hypothetical protein
MRITSPAALNVVPLRAYGWQAAPVRMLGPPPTGERSDHWRSCAVNEGET